MKPESADKSVTFNKLRCDPTPLMRPHFADEDPIVGTDSAYNPHADKQTMDFRSWPSHAWPNSSSASEAAPHGSTKNVKKHIQIICAWYWGALLMSICLRTQQFSDTM